MFWLTTIQDLDLKANVFSVLTVQACMSSYSPYSKNDKTVIIRLTEQPLASRSFVRAASQSSKTQILTNA